MQVFTNLQFKFFWLLSIFCYVIFVGEASWGQTTFEQASGGLGNFGSLDGRQKIKKTDNCARKDSGGKCIGHNVTAGNAQHGTRTVEVLTDAGLCISKGRPPSKIGCVQSSNSGAVCDWSVNHCKSPNYCKANKGFWHNGRCNDSPEQREEVADTFCNGDDVEKHPSTADCTCKATGDPAVDGKCVTESSAEKVARSEEFARLCKEKLGTPTKSDEGTPFCECNNSERGINVYDQTAKCDNSSVASSCAAAGGVLGQFADGGWQADACVCESPTRGQYSINSNNQKCDSPVVAAAAPTVNDTEAILQACGYSDAANRVAKCMDQSVSALKTCDKRALESDENNETAKGILGILAQVHTQKGVQSGNADVCGDVAKKTTAASWLLDGLKETCSKEIASCKASCANLGDKYNWEELDKKCTAEFRKKFPDLAALDAAPVQVRGASRAAVIAADAKAVREKRAPTYSEKELSDGVTQSSIRQLVAELKTESEANAKKCEYDAPKNERDLLGYAEDVVKAAISATACKNAVGVNANRCALIAGTLTPQFCAANPGEVCCPMSDGIVNCNNQQYYNHVSCICQRNQSDPVCKTTTVVGTGNSQLAAPGSTANLAAPGGIKAGAASKPTNFNGDGFNVNEDPNAGGKPPAAATGPSMNPFAGTSGGGGGGGVSAPGAAGGGGGPGEKGAAEPESQGLVGGAFSALKTVADRVFGGGGSGGKGGFGPGRAADLKKKNGRIDPEKWRPTGLRGVAGVSGEVGPKSRDIWKQMNAQYATQYHTFLDGMPSK